MAVKLKAKEKRKDTHLNAEFQRIARRDKKAFLNDQSKEIEDNSRMGKTRDLFKKIRDTKEAFHVFFSQLFGRPPWTTILPFCISFPWGWS